jgi:hypothetical protein
LELDTCVLLGLNNIEKDVGESRMLFALDTEGVTVSISGLNLILSPRSPTVIRWGKKDIRPGARDDDNNNDNSNQPTTHLLELELGSATDVGVGVGGADEPAANCGGIHRTQILRPALASKTPRVAVLSGGK